MTTTELFKIAEETFSLCLDTMKKKNSDYSSKNPDTDALKNFKLVSYLEVTDPATGILVRLSDKFSRLANVYKGDLAVKSESVEDTINDAINYLIILKATLRECKTK
jgi:hypothetical protein